MFQLTLRSLEDCRTIKGWSNSSLLTTEPYCPPCSVTSTSNTTPYTPVCVNPIHFVQFVLPDTVCVCSVQCYSQVNKMTAQNLAVVFVPMLFEELAMNKNLVNLTRELIIHHILIFQVGAQTLHHNAVRDQSLLKFNKGV